MEYEGPTLVQPVHSEDKESRPPLSLDGEYFFSECRKFEETVLLVPFYHGKKPQLQKHIDFFNELGFDVVAFELEIGQSLVPEFMSARAGMGYKHVWADQVECLLNEIPGRKIIYSFSNPSSGAIEAIGRRRGYDVVSLLCDGGPTAKYWDSILKYFTTEEPVPIKPLRYLFAAFSTALWSAEYDHPFKQDFEKFPNGFPILSIRGWKDHLIPPQHIDMVFEGSPHLSWQKLSLPEGGHLNGLKDFAAEYQPMVTSFLSKYARAL